VRKFTLLDVLYPSAKYAHRHLVLLFARDRAGVTSNATVLIDDKSVSHLWTFVLLPHDGKDFRFDIIADPRARLAVGILFGNPRNFVRRSDCVWNLFSLAKAKVG
jgi:hypothetical protein